MSNHFFGLLAFQDRFIFQFEQDLEFFMIVLKKHDFLGQNLGILHSKIYPKSTKLHMRFYQLRSDF